MFSISPLVQKSVDETQLKYPAKEHPLILGIQRGDYNPQEIRFICGQIYHVVKNFPRFLSAITCNMQDTLQRMPLVENLFEEHGRMNKEHIHLNTYIDFCRQIGISQLTLESSRPIPGVTAYVRSVIDTCLHFPYREGLAALGVIEDIVHQVSPIIGKAALRMQQDPDRVSHFTEHEVLDDQHSKEIYELLTHESSEHEEQIQRGLELGGYYHYRLYTDILDAVKTLSDYPLQVGEAGQTRLEILNRIYNPKSVSLIEGLIQDYKLKNILEVGCGTGELALDLSKTLPDSVQLTATDQSPEQIQLAARVLSDTGTKVLTCGTDNLLSLGQKFDLVYLRWVAIYQSDLGALAEQLTEALNPGGFVVIEDNNPDGSGCRSNDPHAQAVIDQWNLLWSQGTREICGTLDLCGNLRSELENQGLSFHSLDAISGDLVSSLDKSVFYLGVVEAKPFLIDKGLSSEAVDEMIAALKGLTEDSNKISFVENFRLVMRKT